MSREDWYKKDVDLQWQGVRLSLAVAQELFSSHAIDSGTRLLLKSLHPERFPDRGTACDYGCGYGVLGLAWKALKPDWTLRLVDRDALAVEFSRWNAERLGFTAGSGLACSVGLGVECAPPEGFDLVLWNVPGKAGESVLRHLAGDVGNALGARGVAALVVVNPLAAPLRSVFEERPDLNVVVDEEFSQHTVIHLKKDASIAPHAARLGTFERGVFDRDPRAFEGPVGTYPLTPVVGLPEYESQSYETTLMLSAIHGLPEAPRSLLVSGCGQGHVPVGARLMHGTTKFTLIDRDLLALKASTRALRASGTAEVSVRVFARTAIGSLEPDTSPVDTAIVMLEDQQPSAVTTTLIDDLEALSSGDLTVVVGGGSTSVTRFVGVLGRRSTWRQKSRTKKHGASAIVLSVG